MSSFYGAFVFINEWLKISLFEGLNLELNN